MLNPVRFGDAFKVTVPSRSFAEAEALYRQKEGPLPDYMESALKKDPADVLQNEADFEAIHPARAAEEMANLSWVEEELAPAIPEPNANHTKAVAVYLVNNGPEGDDLKLMETLKGLQQIKARAEAQNIPLPKPFKEYYQELLGEFHKSLKYAIELPKLPYTSRR